MSIFKNSAAMRQHSLFISSIVRYLSITKRKPLASSTNLIGMQSSLEKMKTMHYPTLTVMVPWGVFLTQIDNTALNFAELTSIIRHLRKNIVAQHYAEFYKLRHRITLKAHRNRFKPSDESLFVPLPPPKKNKNKDKTITTKCLLNFRELNTVHENNFSVPIINLSDQVVTDSVLLTLNLPVPWRESVSFF